MIRASLGPDSFFGRERVAECPEGLAEKVILSGPDDALFLRR